MKTTNWKIKKNPLSNRFVAVIGPQGVGKTSCGTAILTQDFKYHGKERTKIANNYIKEINQNRVKKISFLNTHLYFSNFDIVLNKKHDIHTHLVHLNDLSIPDKQKLNYFPRGAVFFIQEADSEADSRDWRKLAKGLIEFAKRFRHMNYTVILDMQLSGNLDKKLRDLLTDIFFMYKCETKRKWLFKKIQLWRFYSVQNQLNEFVKQLASIGVDIKIPVLEKMKLEDKPSVFSRYDSFSSSPYFLNGLVEYVFKEHPKMDYSEQSIEKFCEENRLAV